MIDDIMTVVWKEMKEFWQSGGSVRARLLSFSYLPIVLIFGIFLPIFQADLWMEAPLAGIFAMILPFVVAAGAVPDSFAGERERHTLETLLATRLSDRDIFLGKVLSIVINLVGLAWACALLSLITLNIRQGLGRLFIYSASTLAMIVVGAVLVSVFATTIGVFISLKSASVRAAGQVYLLVILVLFVGGPLLLRALQDQAKVVVVWALSTGKVAVIGIAGAFILLAIDVALLALGIARFQRARLILD